MSFDSELRAALTATGRELPDEAAVVAGIHRAVGRRRRRRAVLSTGLAVLALALAPVAIDRAADRPDTAPANPAPKVSTRVVTVPEYRALSPAATPCVIGGDTKAQAVELIDAMSSLLAGATPTRADVTCVEGTAAGFRLGAGGALLANVSYHQGSFAEHRGECKPACGPADAIVRTTERALPGRSTPSVRYEVSVVRPDDRIVRLRVEPDRTGVPALSMTALIELATGQSLATHASTTQTAPDLSAPIR